MDNDNDTIQITVKKSELNKYIKKPCISNWKNQANNSIKNSICDSCPFRNDIEQYIVDNPLLFKTFIKEVSDNPSLYPRILNLMKK
jgi:hypothetical protein